MNELKHLNTIGTCKDCKERYPACHDHCERYLTAKKEIIERKMAYRKAVDGEYQLMQMRDKKKIKKMKKYGSDLW